MHDRQFEQASAEHVARIEEDYDEYADDLCDVTYSEDGVVKIQGEMRLKDFLDKLPDHRPLTDDTQP